MIIKIKDARYAGTIYDRLPSLPEIAFAGRSNVGKSSLINALLSRKSLVRISKKPGKTRNVNYFHVDIVNQSSFYMVDLPGYGYARVSHDIQRDWEMLVMKYLHDNNNLKLIMLLIDIRRDLKDEEHMILDLMRRYAYKTVLIATKTDKLGYAQRLKRISELNNQSGIEPLLSSALTKEGVEAIWHNIMDHIKG